MTIIKEYEPKEEGLDIVHITRKVAEVTYHISKNANDLAEYSKYLGYKAPFPEKERTQYFKEKEERKQEEEERKIWGHRGRRGGQGYRREERGGQEPRDREDSRDRAGSRGQEAENRETTGNRSGRGGYRSRGGYRRGGLPRETLEWEEESKDISYGRGGRGGRGSRGRGDRSRGGQPSGSERENTGNRSEENKREREDKSQESKASKESLNDSPNESESLDGYSIIGSSDNDIDSEEWKENESEEAVFENELGRYKEKTHIQEIQKKSKNLQIFQWAWKNDLGKFENYDPDLNEKINDFLGIMRKTRNFKFFN